MRTLFFITCFTCFFMTTANAQRTMRFLENFGEAVSNNSDVVNDGITDLLEIIVNTEKGAAELPGLWAATSALSNQECVPDFSQDLSSIIVSCNGEPTCKDCFDKTLEKLNFYRRQLARLRCIYNNTKTYKESAVALGDNMSGIHAMSGIAWQNERIKIMNTFQNTQRIYDTKSQEFLAGLYDTLQELNTCMHIAGENNWYAKSGFIYFEFMQERYKRND